MIHRASRHRLALALRRYAAKRCTNDDLDSVEVDWRDRGAVAVKQMAWRIYDDLHTHRAVGRYSLSREARRAIARWVIFLHSEQEYLWPEYNFVRIAPGIFSAFTLGWWGRQERKRWDEFLASGDFDVWPFVSTQAELSARAQPKLLNHVDA